MKQYANMPLIFDKTSRDTDASLLFQYGNDNIEVIFEGSYTM